MAATCGLEADEVGQFVDAFLLDHGGIHVGEQQPLAPARALAGPRRRRARRRARSRSRARQRAVVVFGRVEGNVGRDAPCEPVGRLGALAGPRARASSERVRRARAVTGWRSGWRQGHRAHERARSGGAYRRPDGERQVGPGAGARGASSAAWIINADSMQVYRDLRVITARPTPTRRRSAPHRLYGHVDAAGTIRSAATGATPRRRSWPSRADGGCRSSSAAPGSISRR